MNPKQFHHSMFSWDSKSRWLVTEASTLGLNHYPDAIVVEGNLSMVPFNFSHFVRDPADEDCRAGVYTTKCHGLSDVQVHIIWD